MSIRLRPRGTNAAPIATDWDDEVGTCPGCNAIIYGAGKCCTGIRTTEAYAATQPSDATRSE